MLSRRGKLIKTGAMVGSFLSLTVFIMMDLLFTDFGKGTWRDAVAADMKTFMGLSVSPDSPLVYLGYILTLLLLMAIGAVMGMAAMLFLEWFFMLLTGEE